MRIALGGALAQAHHVEQVGDDAARLRLAVGQPVEADGLGDDVQHAHARIQRGIRILEDHLDLAAEGIELLLALERGQVGAAEVHRSGRRRV